MDRSGMVSPFRGCEMLPGWAGPEWSAPSGLASLSWAQPSTPSGLAILLPQLPAPTVSPYGAGCRLRPGCPIHHQPLRGWPRSPGRNPQPLRGWRCVTSVTISPYGAGVTFAMMRQPLWGWCRGGYKPLKRSFSGLKRGLPSQYRRYCAAAKIQCGRRRPKISQNIIFFLFISFT